MKSALVLVLSLCAFAADKDKTEAAPAAAQPTVETLDLDTIARIRDEGINNSHIMEYASGLFDGVGSRLTGSTDFLKAQKWAVRQSQIFFSSGPHPSAISDLLRSVPATPGRPITFRSSRSGCGGANLFRAAGTMTR